MATLSPYYPVNSTTSSSKNLDYFTVTVFHDARAHSASSSRPSSSSSSSSYPSPASTTYTDSPVSSVTGSSRSASWSSFPSCPSSRPRPLPTPPTPSASPRASLPPRPLPHPPLVRPQSEFRPARRSLPLPTPPTVPESSSASARPVPSQTPPRSVPPPEPAMPAAQPTTAKAGATNPAASTSASASSARPIMSLTIPAAWPAAGDAAPQLSVLTPLSPLSPIAFGFPGPRELRKRREDELDRCMKDLGFVEAPSPVRHAKVASSSACSSSSESDPKTRLGAHARAFSASCADESDEERDVVLLVDEHTDEEPEHEEHPTRSESRAAMLTLFADIDTAPSPIAVHPLVEPAVDVQVEIVSKKAAARTRRRFSRKWVREKSGKRWTEKDFSEILCQLRKLR